MQRNALSECFTVVYFQISRLLLLIVNVKQLKWNLIFNVPTDCSCQINTVE